MSDSSVGIVLPVYRVDVDELNKYIEGINDEICPEEIIVEYDDPKDLDQVDTSVSLITSNDRRGKGAAIKHGFNSLNTDILVFSDGDGSIPPKSLKKIINHVKDDEADFSMGSRRHPEADQTYHHSYTRKYLGDIFAFFVRGLMDAEFHDYQCGAKAIKRESWEKIQNDITKEGFSFDLELVIRSHNRNIEIKEIPIRWEDKPGSTVSPVRDSFKLGRTLLSIHLQNRFTFG